MLNCLFIFILTLSILAFAFIIMGSVAVVTNMLWR